MSKTKHIDSVFTICLFFYEHPKTINKNQMDDIIFYGCCSKIAYVFLFMYSDIHSIYSTGSIKINTSRQLFKTAFCRNFCSELIQHQKAGSKCLGASYETIK